MTVGENDFVVAIEECGELIEALSKAMRFGLDNHHPDKPQETNAQAILKEYYHLQEMIEQIIVGHQIGISEEHIKAIKERKRQAVKKYLQVSINEGRISQEIYYDSNTN